MAVNAATVLFFQNSGEDGIIRRVMWALIA